ncbi:hypothetical protein ECZU27_48800 [Escherichia coli]|nr:hypothetical protein ECZU27_48800 [Escherichia coli]
MKWNVDRKFNFGEIANFQDPRPPANIRPSELKRAGTAKILPPQRAKGTPTCRFLWGLATHVAPGYISRPAAPGATKAAFPFFELAKKNRLNCVLKLVARNGVPPDVKGFWCGVQPRHYATGNKGVQPA